MLPRLSSSFLQKEATEHVAVSVKRPKLGQRYKRIGYQSNRKDFWFWEVAELYYVSQTFQVIEMKLDSATNDRLFVLSFDSAQEDIVQG